MASNPIAAHGCSSAHEQRKPAWPAFRPVDEASASDSTSEWCWRLGGCEPAGPCAILAPYDERGHID
jgi:hypothetical protein